MKHICALIILIIITAAVNPNSICADTIYEQPPFLPDFADVAGMGGAFIVSHGFSSLFYNPAGFASDDSSLTIASAGLWTGADPFTFISLYGSSVESREKTLTEQLFTSGYGSGFSAGLGLVKSGLGIGVFLDMDTFLSGESELADVTGNHSITLGFVIGYAYKFTLSGIVLSIGADIRPMARIYVPLSGDTASDVLDHFTGESSNDLFQALGDAPAMCGPGLAFDGGFIADFGDFSCGFSLRDIGNTRFFYSQSSFDAVIASFSESGLFPDNGSPVSGIYQIPMDFGIGFSLHPGLGDFTKIINPEINLDFQNIINAVNKDNPFLSMLKIGVQARCFDILTLRTGFNSGCLSAGLGLQILFFDFNCAFSAQIFDASDPYLPGNSSLAEFAVRLKL